MTIYLAIAWSRKDREGLISIVIMEKAIILTLSLATLTTYRYHTLFIVIPTYTVHVKLAINYARAFSTDHAASLKELINRNNQNIENEVSYLHS